MLQLFAALLWHAIGGEFQNAAISFEYLLHVVCLFSLISHRSNNNGMMLTTLG